MNAAHVPDKLTSDLLQSDPDLLDIVQEFVDTLHARIAELQAAYSTQNWDTLTMLAHRLKGAGGSYGYPDISELGATMEQQFKAHSAAAFQSWITQLETLASAARRGLPVPA